jgi:type II secretory pathway pseudopilin PulG
MSASPLPRRRRALARGSTILEVVIAMAVMALAGAGAVMGMLTASRHVHDGQLYQVKRLMVEASTQRLWLSNKSALLARAVDRPATFPPDILPGTLPWKVDDSPVVANDPGSGAYFELSASGEVTRPTTPIPAGTACTSDQVPVGMYCREVLVTKGLPRAVPTAASALLPAGAQPITVWTRVWRKGDEPSTAIVHSEVFVQ